MYHSHPLPFQHPFTGICSGPTGSGKTELMKHIILNIEDMMNPPPAHILWYYAEHQPSLEQALGERVEFREGCPTLDDFSDSIGGSVDGSTLVIIDDLMSECDSEVTKLFTKGSHHRNLSIFFLMQNFFYQSKDIRTMSLNSHYILLFKNPRDTQQIKVLGRQMYGRDSGVLEDAFNLATSVPHGYLLIDAKQATPEHLRLRSRILPGEALEVFTNKRLFKDQFIII
jgi:Adenovirus IVa2 protein